MGIRCFYRFNRGRESFILLNESSYKKTSLLSVYVIELVHHLVDSQLTLILVINGSCICTITCCLSNLIWHVDLLDRRVVVLVVLRLRSTKFINERGEDVNVEDGKFFEGRINKSGEPIVDEEANRMLEALLEIIL